MAASLLNAISRSAVRKYSVLLVASAVVPMGVVGLLYDRYARALLDQFAGESVNARLAATASRLSAFLDARTNQLETLAQYPAASSLHRVDLGAGSEMATLARLEADHPDVYGILVFSQDGALVRAIPGQAASGPPYWAGSDFDVARLARTDVRDLAILGPAPPSPGQSGWFLLRERLEGGGSIALHVRLASLTELLGSASEADVLQPLLRTPSGDFDALGRLVPARGGVALGPEVLPGWRPCLRVDPEELLEPFRAARGALIVASLVAAGTIGWILARMAARLKQRVDLLAAGAEVVAAGDFSHRVEVVGDDEIAQLARAFNRMSSRLGRLVERTVRMKRGAALGQFSTGVAHEVRNPLAALKTSIQAMMRLEREPQRAALLVDMEREVERMARAMDAILTFGRPRPPERQEISLAEEARRLIQLVAPEAGERKVRVRPGEGIDERVLVDPDHLRQILMNLVRNAVQATPQGGEVTLSARHGEGRVVVEVADTGGGIPAETLAHVFEPFFTTKPSGTGLGLAISRQLAELNGGSLSLRSAVGAGTRAILVLAHGGDADGDHPDHRR